MSSRPPTSDDEATEVYDSQRVKRPTTRGVGETCGGRELGQGGTETARAPSSMSARAESLKEAHRRREIHLATPTEITPPRDRSEPIRVISMKTPAELAAEQGERTPHVQRPKLRALSEVSQQNARMTGDLGRLAPPRDAKGARVRKLRDFVVWGSVVIVVGCVVMLAVWFLARR